MGRMLTASEREDRVTRAENYPPRSLQISGDLSTSSIRRQLSDALDLYFTVCAISRGRGTEPGLSLRANSAVFPFRVKIERTIIKACLAQLRITKDPTPFLGGAMFGASKKQGTSLRFPLASCQPTALCASACYAHDVLDAAPNSVIRGALNGAVGLWFSELSSNDRLSCIKFFQKDIQRAVRNSLNELALLPADYKRPAFIRFAHVGDAAAYTKLANALAAEVVRISLGKVQCVVYSRHKKAMLFDPKLFVVNFTLDGSSMDRENWIPAFARRVFSAFGGEVDPGSEINFLEHHRWQHTVPIGQGSICPATRPETPERTCDAVRCHKCFVKPSMS
ncbi:hypothetical protein MCEMIEM12_00296 [Burkholderiaceae bacterium]